MKTKITKQIGNIVFVFSILFGLYIIANGHLSPGGGFQGGAIIATGYLLKLLVNDLEENKIFNRTKIFSYIESTGLLMFLIFALIGIKNSVFNNVLAKPILYGSNPGTLVSGGSIPLMNIAVGIEVFAALSIIIMLFYMQYSNTKSNDIEAQ